MAESLEQRIQIAIEQNKLWRKLERMFSEENFDWMTMDDEFRATEEAWFEAREQEQMIFHEMNELSLLSYFWATPSQKLLSPDEDVAAIWGFSAFNPFECDCQSLRQRYENNSEDPGSGREYSPTAMARGGVTIGGVEYSPTSLINTTSRELIILADASRRWLITEVDSRVDGSHWPIAIPAEGSTIGALGETCESTNFDSTKTRKITKAWTALLLCSAVSLPLTAMAQHAVPEVLRHLTAGTSFSTSAMIPLLRSYEAVSASYLITAYTVWGVSCLALLALEILDIKTFASRPLFVGIFLLNGLGLVGTFAQSGTSVTEGVAVWGPLAVTGSLCATSMIFKPRNYGRSGRQGITGRTSSIETIV
ncbi:hypothetical protein QBC38DRAFT_474708 [Podospora fimiseda]|uniref:Uncharacterized protein n=1 Tax=Podospora fimiseda TaxID=252190 RepID=A0AAN7BS90_9PEZI|nr:hypothetical protein QBC38DRAFT_474708 [Podospora fimiseda]